MRSTHAWTLGQITRMNREESKKMKETKEEWIEEQCIIDNEMTAGSRKKTYSTLKTLTQTSQP